MAGEGKTTPKQGAGLVGKTTPTHGAWVGATCSAVHPSMRPVMRCALDSRISPRALGGIASSCSAEKRPTEQTATV